MTDMTHLDDQQPASQQMVDAAGSVKRSAEVWVGPVAPPAPAASEPPGFRRTLAQISLNLWRLV